MSHFGELTDVVWPKIAQKQPNSQDLVIFLKCHISMITPKLPTSGFLISLLIENRKFGYFGATSSGFHKNRQLFTILLLFLVGFFLAIFGKTTSGISEM